MNQNILTALAGVFVRAYHNRINSERIFSDSIAEQLMIEEEYENFSKILKRGARLFNFPSYENEGDTLRRFIDNYIAPVILGRSAYFEEVLQQAVYLGYNAYLNIAAGYDTYAFRTHNHEMRVYEVDLEEVLQDKKRRIKARNLKSFCDITYCACDFTKDNYEKDINKIIKGENRIFIAISGLSYYLSEQDFKRLLYNISSMVKDGSILVFDYAVDYYESALERVNANNKKKQIIYSQNKILQILSEVGFFIKEELNDVEINERYFASYNRNNPEHQIYAPKGVHYCVAVKNNYLIKTACNTSR